MAPVIDESQLTAYALGELSGAERAAVAAFLAGNAEARQYVSDIRSTANLLVDELARESFGGLSDLQYAAIEEQLDDAMRVPAARPRVRRKVRRERLIFAMSLAASVLIVFGGVAVLIPFVYHRMELAIQRENAKGENQENGSRKIVIKPSNSGNSLPSIPTQVAENVPTPPTIPGDPGEDDMPPGDGLVPGGPLPDQNQIVSPGNEELFPAKLIGPAVTAHVDPIRTPKLIKPGVNPPSVKRPSDVVVPNRSDNFAKKYEDPEHATRGSKESDQYTPLVENGFVDTATDAISGFSAGVDTASYSNIRRYLSYGRLPPKDAVRIEEMLNYFPPVRSTTTPPLAGEGPLAVQVEIGSCPWKPERRLARVSVVARELPPGTRPAVNVVFVIDVSRSMRDKTKLPLLKQAMKMFAGRLSARDRMAIVGYADEAGIVLNPTAGDDKTAIFAGIERIDMGGKTRGGQGMELAYELAARNLVLTGVNRVILASDGNWNVGTTTRGQLPGVIQEQVEKHISLTVLGVGMDNLKDATLQQLAIKGNGSYAYIDTLEEARKVLIDQSNGALISAARDVKVQVTFDPAVAKSYRLIGYERRLLSREELTSQSKHGGELGAGQSVTALYEVIVAGKTSTTRPAQLMTASVSYVDPMTSAAGLLTTIGEDRATPLPRMSSEFRFIAAVAEFGLLLRDSDYKGNATFSAVLDRVKETPHDEFGYRQEFVKLVRKAKSLATAR